MSNKIIVPYNYTPRSYQMPAWKAIDSGIRRVYRRWCRRAGKDLDFINMIFREMIKRPGNYYYIFPKYAQGRKAMFEGKERGGRAYLDYMPKELIKGNINKNEMKFETVNGSLFRIVGGDDYDTSIVGTGLCGVGISEFALQDKNLMNFLRPILRETDALVLVNGTPRGKNHMYDFEQSIIKNPKWHCSVIQCLWPDLPDYYPTVTSQQLEDAFVKGTISKEEFFEESRKYTLEAIEEDRKEGAYEDLIEQEYGVSFSAGVQGAYFADQIQRAREQGRIGNFPHSDHLWVDTFWDLGFRDDNPIWFRQTDGKAKIWIDYYEDKGHDIAHYVEVLKAKGYNYRTHYVPHDAEQGRFQAGISHKQMLVQTLRSAGLSDDVVVAPKCNTKQQAIDGCRQQFSYYYFNEKTTSDGILKLSLYHRKYDKSRDAFLEMPVHDWTSHAADAIMNDALSINLQDDILNPTSNKIKTSFDLFDWDPDNAI